MLDYQKTLDCVHCGLCLPACPTYRETGRESSSPRGRIYLMRGVAEGRLELDEHVVSEAYFCLACRACESACPAGVQYGELIESLRAEISERGARSRLSQGFERLLLRRGIGSPRTLAIAFGMLRAYQRSGLQRLVRSSGLLGVLPGLREAERRLPPLPDREALPVLVPAQGPRRGRVALLRGCVMPELFSAANAATARVLAKNGYEVLTPRDQTCCGALHLHAGDPQGAERLRRRNRSAFHVDDVDAIVTNSAGCGTAMKEAGDDLAPKVRDVSEFLYDVGLRPPGRRLPLRVAYDDPCHLLHGQRIAHAPRALLRGIEGVELLDLPGASDCCGAAGIYNLTHPATSDRLLENKLRGLRAVRPDVLATGNPGCLMQFQHGVREAGLDVEVLHPVELLDRAYS